MNAVELDRFRAEVREFLENSLSAQTAERVKSGYYLSLQEMRDWHRALYARGWIGLNWPKEHGGPAWTARQRMVFDEECAKAGAPIIPMVGLNQVAALLINFGTAQQKERFLPSIRDGSETWCQGFSEPQSGSDLASLRCSARLEGDHYVVNGTKTWTTGAHWADWCILLVRTDSSGRKQEGLTILLMDMKTAGITVRPIIGIDGQHSLNEMFLDNVAIPITNRVGDQDRGWDLMKVFLGHERISAAGVWKCRAHFARLCAISLSQKTAGASLSDDPVFRYQLALIEIRLRALESILLNIIDNPARAIGVEASVLKLRGTELQQDILRMISDAAGHYALPMFNDVLKEGWGEKEPVGPEFAAPATPNYLFWRKGTISGGTSEIMLNLIARHVFG